MVSKLPSNIGFVLSKTPSWFRHSELRQEAYKELFKVINTAALQNQAFKELAILALTCLITPVINAVVVRIFSLVLSVKTKAGNRMQLNRLDAAVRIRANIIQRLHSISRMLKTHNNNKQKTTATNKQTHRTMGRIVMNWIWSLSFSGYFLVLFGFKLKFQSGNPE